MMAHVIIWINVDLSSVGSCDIHSPYKENSTERLMMTSSNGNIFRVTGHLCREFTGPGEFPTQRPVTRSFDVFFDLHLNKRLSKQPWGWWFETLSWSLWRQCDVKVITTWHLHMTYHRVATAREKSGKFQSLSESGKSLAILVQVRKFCNLLSSKSGKSQEISLVVSSYQYIFFIVWQMIFEQGQNLELIHVLIQMSFAKWFF